VRDVDAMSNVLFSNFKCDTGALVLHVYIGSSDVGRVCDVNIGGAVETCVRQAWLCGVVCVVDRTEDEVSTLHLRVQDVVGYVTRLSPGVCACVLSEPYLAKARYVLSVTAGGCVTVKVYWPTRVKKPLWAQVGGGCLCGRGGPYLERAAHIARVCETIVAATESLL
jgi:hypothetical protein